MSGKAFFRIKAVPETTGLTRPDPAQLHTYADCAHPSAKFPPMLSGREREVAFQDQLIMILSVK